MVKNLKSSNFIECDQISGATKIFELINSNNMIYLNSLELDLSFLESNVSD